MGKNIKKNPDGRLEYIGTMRFHKVVVVLVHG